MAVSEQRAGVDLTNLDEALSPEAGATKRDLVDYLDGVAERMLPGLAGRPLTVLRVLRGQKPFMQKNVPKYTPDWVRTVPMWAEASRREVHYALCDDRRTLLWLANQRAVEYHPTLGLADNGLSGAVKTSGAKGVTSSYPSTTPSRSTTSLRPRGRSRCGRRKTAGPRPPAVTLNRCK